MSIFNGKDGFAKAKNEYIEENSLKDLDDDILKSIKDMAVAEKLTGAYSTFTSNDTKALFHELLMIKQQNWIKIRQNQEMINQLRKLNSK
ncbi:hypothetical protein FOD75_03075 [Limosilactobacillus reuteri]|uniref:Uncharacterized protein n=1 Tax=Limosilactobacillus reuteri TaxID=1598 RepID=A0A517D471_LIMRT|nr:hypothetical protein [Limosilactobacillus reuteri]QDR72142.1 hypothetical protein FOD75_03075 [Limosilactobacillus reuteri]